MNRREKVKLLKKFYSDHSCIFAEWSERGYNHPPPVSPPFPEACRDMKCEAKTRAGTPCKNDGTSYPNGRCKFHGGASTGPTTLEGKRKVALNGKKKGSAEANPMET